MTKLKFDGSELLDSRVRALLRTQATKSEEPSNRDVREYVGRKVWGEGQPGYITITSY